MVACSLRAAERDDRLRAWRRLADEHLREQADVPGGVAMTYAGVAGVAETVHRLARLERECCAWATWRVAIRDGGVRLEVTTSADHEAAPRSMLASRRMRSVSVSHERSRSA